MHTTIEVIGLNRVTRKVTVKDMPRETLTEASGRKWCKTWGALCIKFADPSKKGAPDRLILEGGDVLFLETKTDIGELSPHQVLYHKMLKGMGFSVAVVRCITDFKMMCASHFFEARKKLHNE